MKCENCGITIPEVPEDATYDEMLCDRCNRIEESQISCRFCGEYIDPLTAHRHSGAWVGDECCWDQRLRSSE